MSPTRRLAAVAARLVVMVAGAAYGLHALAEAKEPILGEYATSAGGPS